MTLSTKDRVMSSDQNVCVVHVGCHAAMLFALLSEQATATSTSKSGSKHGRVMIKHNDAGLGHA